MQPTEFTVPSHTVNNAVLIEPQYDSMLVKEVAVDVSNLGADLQFDTSIDLNKKFIVDIKRLKRKVNRWIEHYENQRTLNPDTKVNTETEEGN